jgi:MYXO-CTERM domain-containing protein
LPKANASDNCSEAAPICNTQVGVCQSLPAGVPMPSDAKVAGGGMSCSTLPGSSSNDAALFAVAGLAAVVVARRRKRA